MRTSSAASSLPSYYIIRWRWEEQTNWRIYSSQLDRIWAMFTFDFNELLRVFRFFSVFVEILPSSIHTLGRTHIAERAYNRSEQHNTTHRITSFIWLTMLNNRPHDDWMVTPSLFVIIIVIIYLRSARWDDWKRTTDVGIWAFFLYCWDLKITTIH